MNIEFNNNVNRIDENLDRFDGSHDKHDSVIDNGPITTISQLCEITIKSKDTDSTTSNLKDHQLRTGEKFCEKEVDLSASFEEESLDEEIDPEEDPFDEAESMNLDIEETGEKEKLEKILIQQETILENQKEAKQEQLQEYSHIIEDQCSITRLIDPHSFSVFTSPFEADHNTFHRNLPSSRVNIDKPQQNRSQYISLQETVKTIIKNKFGENIYKSDGTRLDEQRLIDSIFETIEQDSERGLYLTVMENLSKALAEEDLYKKEDNGTLNLLTSEKKMEIAKALTKEIYSAVCYFNNQQINGEKDKQHDESYSSLSSVQDWQKFKNDCERVFVNFKPGEYHREKLHSLFNIASEACFLLSRYGNDLNAHAKNILAKYMILREHIFALEMQHAREKREIEQQDSKI